MDQAGRRELLIEGILWGIEAQLEAGQAVTNMMADPWARARVKNREVKKILEASWPLFWGFRWKTGGAL